MDEENSLTQKIDVLDMLISIFTEYEKEISNLVLVLREHEKALDDVVARLEKLAKRE